MGKISFFSCSFLYLVFLIILNFTTKIFRNSIIFTLTSRFIFEMLLSFSFSNSYRWFSHHRLHLRHFSWLCSLQSPWAFISTKLSKRYLLFFCLLLLLHFLLVSSSPFDFLNILIVLLLKTLVGFHLLPIYFVFFFYRLINAYNCRKDLRTSKQSDF